MNAWKITLRKTLRAALGLLVCSIGSYCTIVADVGLAPWDALFMGVSEHLPVSYGTVSVTCGLIVVVVDLLMHEKIGVGMLLDAFMVGKVIDLLRYLDVLAQPTSYAMRVGLMILGITILCCGLPIYMGDRMKLLKEAGIYNEHYIFSTEGPKECETVLNYYQKGLPTKREVRRIK